MTRILILRDSVLGQSVVRFMENDAYDVRVADGVTEARSVLEAGGVRLLLTPVEHRGRSLVHFIEDVAARNPMTALVVVASESTIDVALDLRARLWIDMLRMPLTFIYVRDSVRRALDARDLNTPIARIRQHLQRLASDDLPEPSKEVLRRMSQELETLASRVRSVTDSR